MSSNIKTTPTKSAGHICFSADGREFYEMFGEVYRANLDSVVDVSTGARIGRWECSRAQFDRFRTMLVPEEIGEFGP